jgi:hypothetical protein
MVEITASGFLFVKLIVFLLLTGLETVWKITLS